MNKKLIWGIIIVVIIIGFIYLYRELTFTTPSTAGQSQTNSTVSTNISNWKTYKDFTNGFELKYPTGYADFTATNTQSPNVIDSVIARGTEMFEKTDANGNKWKSTYPSIRIQTYPLDKYVFRDAPGGTSYTYNKATNKCIHENTSTDPKKISSVSSACLVGTGDAGFSFAGYAIPDIKNNRMIEVGFGYDETAGADIDRDLVLSTFKFTSNTSVNQVHKNYTNKILGFSLQYPSTWQIVRDDPEGVIFSNLRGSSVRILPLGEPKGGRREPRVPSDINFSEPTITKIDFLTLAKERYATYIRLDHAGKNTWNESGMIDAVIAIENSESHCLRNNVEIDYTKCDFDEGDVIAYSGKVSTVDREVIKEILSSFKFIK